jgi:hypothetical protein
MGSGRDQYLGTWEDADGNRLSIRLGAAQSLLVSFYAAPDREPIPRPWLGNRPSVDMLGRDAIEELGCFEVDLAGARDGFTLHLTFEPAYERDSQRRDALVPALSEFEGDR